MFASSSSTSSSEDDDQPKTNDHPILSAARAVAARARRTRPNTQAIAAAAAAAYEGNNDGAVNEKLVAGAKHAAGSDGKSKSRYIGKLLISAKQRAEEAETRRADQAERSHVPRFVTKSYEAALRRRDEERRSQIAAVATTETATAIATPNPDSIDKTHGAALMFVVEQQATANASLNENKSQSHCETETEKEKEKEKKDQNKYHEKIDINNEKNNPDGKKEADNKCEGDKVNFKDKEKTDLGSDANKKQNERNKTRGLRRNDAQSIEAYRRRYFERLAIAQQERRGTRN